MIINLMCALFTSLLMLGPSLLLFIILRKALLRSTENNKYDKYKILKKVNKIWTWSYIKIAKAILISCFFIFFTIFSFLDFPPDIAVTNSTVNPRSVGILKIN